MANINTNKRSRINDLSLVQIISLAMVALFVVIPMLVTAFGGFKSTSELRTNPFGLPKSWSPERFVDFRELPKELIDAARMDNCGYIRIYAFITLPLCLPIIATVGVFAFVSSWNNFLLPLLVLNDTSKYTWPLGIMQYQGEFFTEWPRILAYLTLTILPAIIFFLAAQRYIFSGLTSGSVKG